MKKFLIIFGIISVLFTSNVYAIDPTQITPSSSQNSILFDGSSFGTSSLASWGTTGYGNAYSGFFYKPTASHFVCQVDFSIRKSGAPTDSIRLYVRYGVEDNLQDGTELTQSANVYFGSDFLTTGHYITSFYFGTANPPGNCFAVSKDVTYSFYLQRSGTLNFTNHYYSLTNVATDPSSQTNIATNVGVNTNAPWVQIYGIENGSSIDNSAVDTSSFCDGLGVFTTACQTAVFLLIPNVVTVQNDISELYNEFNTKAPFGYITEALSIDLTNVSTGSGVPSFSIPIDVHVAGNSTLDTTMDWTDAEGLNIVSNYASQIRMVFMLLIWMVFIFYIFVIVRHIL